MKEMNTVVREGKSTYTITEKHTSKSEFRKSLNNRGLTVITKVWLAGEKSPMQEMYQVD